MEEQQAQYLTVRQFADLAGVSTQRIYKALQSGLQQYCKSENGKKYVSSDGLRLFPRSDCQPVANELATDTQQVANQLQPEQQPATPAETVILRQTIDTLTAQLAVKDNQLDVLTAQLSTKDNQIEQKDKQINDLTAALVSSQEQHKALADALTAAQALHAGTIQALQQAQQPPQEQPQDAPVVDAEPEQTVSPAEETPDSDQEQKKPRNFWGWLFHR